MNIILKGRLIQKIEEWMNENCESDEWEETDHYVHTTLKNEMGNAAESVYDATVNYQIWAKEEAV